ncbi:hypothetical protein AMECASPLE_014793 [Ameca splendens]|uniref:Uncharacterized protein n=1 Tax=Ameca splendens TaxID=208324 RepID=A0ABV0YDL7_9TELE
MDGWMDGWNLSKLDEEPSECDHLCRGHNGVRSCVDCLQTDVMLRLRVGIGRPSGKTSVDRHVLSRFTSEEQKVLESVLVQSVDLLISQLSQSDSPQDSQPASSPAGGRQAAQ